MIKIRPGRWEVTMRPSVSALLVSFSLLISFSAAHQRKCESGVPSSGDKDSTIVSLLQQSHELSQQAPLRMRLSLLRTQAQMASHLRPDLSREWANELFTLSSQVTGNEQSWAQDAAMAILARVDPDHALELLHRMNPEEPDTKRTNSPPKMELVRQVFEVLIARDGASALPVLEQEAVRLGIQGHYPYAALGQAAMQAVSKEWVNNKPHAVEVVEAVFERELATYSQDTRRGYFDDLEFGNMLRVVADSLPRESVQPAVRVLVKNLLGADTNKYKFEAKVYTAEGKTATVSNGIDAAILHFGDLVNRIDPALAQELESTRPELQVALEYTKDGLLRSSMFGAHVQDGRPRDVDAETSMDARRLAPVNAEAAIAKVEQLKIDERADAALEVARSIAGDNPGRAAELIAEVQPSENIANEELRLNLVSARVSVAASQDKKGELHQLLQSGFELADRIILGQQRGGHVDFVPGLTELVEIGIQNDLHETIAFVQNLPASDLKAQLLLGAASALSMPMRLPLRSRSEQKPERSAQ